MDGSRVLVSAITDLHFIHIVELNSFMTWHVEYSSEEGKKKRAMYYW